MTQAYPLQWPEMMPRTARPVASKFKTTLHGALSNVEDSLRRFGEDTGHKVTQVVISSNYTLGVTNPAESGVAVWFDWDGAQRCIAVDRYNKLACNLQAIHHIIEARRTEMRHGGLTIVRAAFKGFDALPSPDGASGQHWSDVLGVDRRADMTVIGQAWRSKAKAAHPDQGGTAEQFHRIQTGYEQAKAERA